MRVRRWGVPAVKYIGCETLFRVLIELWLDERVGKCRRTGDRVGNIQDFRPRLTGAKG